MFVDGLPLVGGYAAVSLRTRLARASDPTAIGGIASAGARWKCVRRRGHSTMHPQWAASCGDDSQVLLRANYFFAAPLAGAAAAPLAGAAPFAPAAAGAAAPPAGAAAAPSAPSSS